VKVEPFPNEWAPALHHPSMCLDKGGWVEPASRIFGITRANKGGNEFAHLEMQMRKGGHAQRDPFFH
jgi:hypothetical protein